MTPEPRGRFEKWANPDSFGATKARDLAAMLELRGGAEDQRATRAAYLELLSVAPGDRVLDVGCGSGVVTRDLARRVAPTGHATGVDPSPDLLAIARELADQENLGPTIDFRVGDARSLPFDSATFDVGLAVTVFSHIPGGEAGVAELVRVVRPGGRVAVVDFDPDSAIVWHPDRVTTRRIVAAYSDHGVADGWLARRLPSLLTAAGVSGVRVRAFTALEQDVTGHRAKSIAQRAALAVRTGVITESDYQRWVDILATEQQVGRFLAGSTYLFAWGTVPA
ncbi:MAG: methyltransferase domain-containing protein [Chloroflexi bacterium]|nr:methyltransferase domain-containing protein [Chloroflexota bacterium]